jgi:predicted dehydrogenase
MHLTPEEIAIGKGNFYSLIGSQHLPSDKTDADGRRISRRDFLLRGMAAGLVSGAGLGGYYFGYDRALGDPVRVGMIGTGDEGGVLIGAHNPDFVRIVAIADIRPYNIHRAFHGDQSSSSAFLARPGLMQKYDWRSEDQARRHVKVYDRDYGELLADPDVEAVIIALPLHLHAQVAIEAMLAGKHVLTEKLMAHSVHECKEMARVAAMTGKLLATGHQRHYSILYDNAVNVLKSGLLGDIHYIRAQWHRGNLPGRDSWQPQLPHEALQDLQKIDAELDRLRRDPRADGARIGALLERRELLRLVALDHDVDAARYGYQDAVLTVDGKPYQRSALEELIRWRLWNRTGGGLMAELGSHQLDAAGIFITAMHERYAESQGRDPKSVGKVKPLTVTAVGGRHIFPADRDIEDHVYCTFEYPAPEYAEDPNKKIVVTYSSINGNGYGGYGEIVMGTSGTLILEREQEVMVFANESTRTKVGVSRRGDDVVLDTTASGDAASAVGQQAIESGPVSRGYTEEMEHWAWCIRNPAPENIPRCHPEVALADAVIALTTNLVMRDPQRAQVTFNGDWFKIDSDATPEGIAPNPQRWFA